MCERGQWYEKNDWSARTPAATLKRGTEAAWAAVFAITGDPSLADDLSQQAALETMEGKRPSDYTDADHVRRRVRRIAVCRTLSLLRRRDRRRTVDPEYLESLQDDRVLSPEERAALMEARRIFLAAVEALPKKLRLVMKARLHGDSPVQIAADLGVSYVTVWRRLNKAVAAILKELDRARVDPSWWSFGIGAVGLVEDDDLPHLPDFDADVDDDTQEDDPGDR